MNDNLPESEKDFNEQPPAKKDRSLLYMGLILGTVILVMGYLTLFVDDPSKLFSKKKENPVAAPDQSKLLDESAQMNDEDVKQSLIKFIEAFYYDQRRGYFDAPSYFAPIVQTFYNYHNLGYEQLKDIYWKKREEMENLKRNWIVSSLNFERGADSRIVANYWAKESYFKPSLRQEQSRDVKYEMVIDDNGKIVSLRELEVKNLQVVQLPPDTLAIDSAVDGGSATAPDPGAQVYDLSVVEVAPQFPGGQAALANYLRSNLHYPFAARQNRVQGKVAVSFVVDRNGKIRDVKIRQGIGSGCDEEALRLIKASPAWEPGMIKGVPVNTYCVLPINFQLVQQ